MSREFSNAPLTRDEAKTVIVRLLFMGGLVIVAWMCVRFLVG